MIMVEESYFYQVNATKESPLWENRTLLVQNLVGAWTFQREQRNNLACVLAEHIPPCEMGRNLSRATLHYAIGEECSTIREHIVRTARWIRFLFVIELTNVYYDPF